jgi:oxygen-independent coproporphyrinogen III oxidase
LAGIYIHVPFCRQACHYCNFHFSTSTRYKNDFVTALLKEIDLFAKPANTPLSDSTLAGEAIETIYFGGGTPSLCSIQEIASIMNRIREVFTVDPSCEVSLEANPDDITAEILTAWRGAGINRLSIGVQSFFEEDLRWMNRAHTSPQATECLKLATSVFPNLSIDLIYGTPQLTDERWKQNVDTAIALGIPHLSCYALTVEPKTPLAKMIREQKSADVDPSRQSDQFLLLMEWLEEAGYEHYEISNFAKPGLRSRHNSSYWQGKIYFGFGPSAHSYDGLTRWWNIANNTAYIQSISKGQIPYEREILTATQKLNEYVMISLRTMEGIDLKSVQLSIERPADTKNNAEILLNKAKKFSERQLVTIENNRIRLTRRGKLLADGIAAELFFE